MAPSPRPDPASREASALRPWMWLVAVIVLGSLLAVGFSGLMRRDQPGEAEIVPSDYSEMAAERGLQVDVETLESEDDWRALADIADIPDRGGNLFAWLTLARVIFWLFVALAVGVLVFLIYLAVRHGAGLRVETRQAPKSGDYTAKGKGGRATATADLPVLTLDEIARLTDAGRALGALQRLVLSAAAEATGSVLRRSETAREALRRLPRDWAHYERVARLVRIAEHVRYAGQPLEEGGLASLVEDARTVLAAKAATS